jgi:hypothetical protein
VAYECCLLGGGFAFVVKLLPFDGFWWILSLKQIWKVVFLIQDFKVFQSHLLLICWLQYTGRSRFLGSN